MLASVVSIFLAVLEILNMEIFQMVSAGKRDDVAVTGVTLGPDFQRIGGIGRALPLNNGK